MKYKELLLLKLVTVIKYLMKMNLITEAKSRRIVKFVKKRERHIMCDFDLYSVLRRLVKNGLFNLPQVLSKSLREVLETGRVVTIVFSRNNR